MDDYNVILKHEIHGNNIKKFSSYLAKFLHLQYEGNKSGESHNTHKCTLGDHLKVGGTYSNITASTVINFCRMLLIYF
jgi:hypothetical protein